jgi:purine nucleoside phosphorylase
LHEAGVQTVIATVAVASLHHFTPGDVIIPDQLIDYTYERENTFLDNEVNGSRIDFAYPYSEPLRQLIIEKAKAINCPTINSATYGIMQGPRKETIAEAAKFIRDGCHIVGMTGMPEAALARELALNYVCIALVVRMAAGLTKDSVPTAFPEQLRKIEDLIVALIKA